MNPLDIWDHYLSQAETTEDLTRLGERMKNDLENYDTFCGHREEMVAMYQERWEEIAGG